MTEEADVTSALGLLALVAGQDVEQGDDGTWQIARNVAPDRVISVVDPEARHMHKSRSEYRDGYKAHLAIEPETGLVTAAALTPANAPDGPTGVELLADEEPGLQILGDGAYGSGETLSALGEVQAPPGHQALARCVGRPRWVRRDDFVIDHEAGTATCPAGHTVTITPSRAGSVRRSLPGLSAHETAAPHPELAGHSASIRTTTNWSSPGEHGEKATSPRTTDGGDRWSSAPSPGWSPTITDGSASAA